MAKTESRPVQLKQYYVLVDYKEEIWKKGWKKGDIILLSQEEASAFIGGKVILPFKTAVTTGAYKTTQEIATYSKPRSSIKFETTPSTDDEPKKKTLVKNTIRAAVQAKKEAAEETLTPPTSPTTFTPEPEVKPKEETEPKKELSAAEKAIQAKIAAAKKKK